MSQPRWGHARGRGRTLEGWWRPEAQGQTNGWPTYSWLSNILQLLTIKHDQTWSNMIKHESVYICLLYYTSTIFTFGSSWFTWLTCLFDPFCFKNLKNGRTMRDTWWDWNTQPLDCNAGSSKKLDNWSNQPRNGKSESMQHVQSLHKPIILTDPSGFCTCSHTYTRRVLIRPALEKETSRWNYTQIRRKQKKNTNSVATYSRLTIPTIKHIKPKNLATAIPPHSIFSLHQDLNSAWPTNISIIIPIPNPWRVTMPFLSWKQRLKIPQVWKNVSCYNSTQRNAKRHTHTHKERERETLKNKSTRTTVCWYMCTMLSLTFATRRCLFGNPNLDSDEVQK